MSEQPLKKAITSHPFIVKKEDICDGSPIIEGTRTRVIDIAIEYEVLGHSPDVIIDSHPYLNLSQVHDALSYYYDNRDELDKKIEQDQEFIRQIRERFPSKMS
ncbi:unnamed protein product [marine sediment metagenome]|uniref:DUF433 domain-containing protein n=1 Tax=marine sediment metagenome TaxID=412755 RepID=X0V081_9ZZZZ